MVLARDDTAPVNPDLLRALPATNFHPDFPEMMMFD
jgi:hypothetical protein